MCWKPRDRAKTCVPVDLLHNSASLREVRSHWNSVSLLWKSSRLVSHVSVGGTMLAAILVLEVRARRAAHSQNRGSAQQTQSGLILPGSLRVNMSRLLQGGIQREGHVSSANQTTQRRTEHL